MTTNPIKQISFFHVSPDDFGFFAVLGSHPAEFLVLLAKVILALLLFFGFLLFLGYVYL